MIGRWGPGRFGEGTGGPAGGVDRLRAGQAAALRAVVWRLAVVVRPGRSGR